MSDQLRHVMTRIAERAEPAPPDPTLWSRARRARSRGEIISASAVGAAVFAVVAALGVVGPPTPDAPDPSPAQRPGIPTVVRGIVGDGGLQLERDLAVGPASVAIANPTGAFVVTADDGVYHRLDLPGFDPAVYDDPAVRRTGMVGLSLSPDGTQLAYGWHARLPEETGQVKGFVRSGLRILDLRTGRTEDVPEDRAPPGEFGMAIGNQDFPWGLVPYGVRWSSDGRYLGYEQVWAATPAEGVEVEHWGTRLGQAYHQAVWASGAAVYDTATGIRRDVFDRAGFDRDFWLSFDWTGWPAMVADNGSLVRDTDELVPGDFTTGLADGERRIVLETRDPSSHLLAVNLRTGAQERLNLDIEPCRVDLLAWIGPKHALAQVHRAEGGDSWAEEGDLVVLDLSDATVESNLAAAIDAGGTESTFSFATDFATVQQPTYDFDAAADDDGDDSAARVGDRLLGADDGGDGPGSLWLVIGLAGGLAAAALVVLGLRRRIRTF